MKKSFHLIYFIFFNASPFYSQITTNPICYNSLTTNSCSATTKL